MASLEVIITSQNLLIICDARIFSSVGVFILVSLGTIFVAN
jgi:hypothetical protein